MNKSKALISIIFVGLFLGGAVNPVFAGAALEEPSTIDEVSITIDRISKPIYEQIDSSKNKILFKQQIVEEQIVEKQTAPTPEPILIVEEQTAPTSIAPIIEEQTAPTPEPILIVEEQTAPTPVSIEDPNPTPAGTSGGGSGSSSGSGLKVSSSSIGSSNPNPSPAGASCEQSGIKKEADPVELEVKEFMLFPSEDDEPEEDTPVYLTCNGKKVKEDEPINTAGNVKVHQENEDLAYLVRVHADSGNSEVAYFRFTDVTDVILISELSQIYKIAMDNIEDRLGCTVFEAIKELAINKLLDTNAAKIILSVTGALSGFINLLLNSPKYLFNMITGIMKGITGLCTADVILYEWFGIDISSTDIIDMVVSAVQLALGKLNIKQIATLVVGKLISAISKFLSGAIPLATFIAGVAKDLLGGLINLIPTALEMVKNWALYGDKPILKFIADLFETKPLKRLMGDYVCTTSTGIVPVDIGDVKGKNLGKVKLKLFSGRLLRTPISLSGGDSGDGSDSGDDGGDGDGSGDGVPGMLL